MTEASYPPLGVYVHWPYCARICPYCDFNVFKNRSVDSDAWVTALTRDLERFAEQTARRPLTSLYFGGGTPSLAPLAVIEAVIEKSATLWGFQDGAEITLEANPTSAEEARFKDFAAAGVNRLSLGVQSLDDEALAFLGRDHSAGEARAALERALALFPTSSFDLIYALPGQAIETWTRALTEALALGTSHMSLYQLTIEPETAFEKAVSRGVWTPPEEGLAADLFDVTQAITASAGLPAYEISNHAKTSARSRHNTLYWTGADYVGVGPGAHGRLTTADGRLATETARAPIDYLSASPPSETLLTSDDIIIEALAMGLRTVDGCALTPPILAHLENRKDVVASFQEAGFISIDKKAIRASSDGRRVLNTLLADLI